MNKQLFSFVLWLSIASSTLFVGCNGGNKAPAISVNGFQYIHHIKNDGPKPQIGEYAYFNIDILVDDSLLQSSRQNNDTPLVQIPTAEQAKQQPNPVIDVLPLMSIGDSVTITRSLDSFPERPQGFEKYKNIIYNVTLTSIKSEEEYKVYAAEEQEKRKEKALLTQSRMGEISELSNKMLADYNSGKLKDKLTETASGLKYLVHEEGTGDVPNVGELIGVHYYGMLTDGTMFDNSFSRGEPYIFPVGQGQVIPGWDEGLTLLKKGTKGMLFIPYDLAYGENGNPPVIPPKSELVFYVELLESPND